MSIRLSVRVEKLGYQWIDFQETLYLSIFRKYVEEIKVSLKFYKNNGHFTRRPLYFRSHLAHFFLK
jgi:hypothetical protein